MSVVVSPPIDRHAARGRCGRFVSQNEDKRLFEVIRLCLEEHDLERLPTDVFNRLRTEVGHPGCLTAATIAARYLTSWRNVV